MCCIPNMLFLQYMELSAKSKIENQIVVRNEKVCMQVWGFVAKKLTC